MAYLVHFNGNHSSKNGQFTYGDGDKDGITDDHHNYSKNKQDLAESSEGPVKAKYVKTVAKLLSMPAKKIAGKMFSKTKAGITYNQISALTKYGKKTLKWDKFSESTGLKDVGNDIKATKNEYENGLYEQAATFINKFV